MPPPPAARHLEFALRPGAAGTIAAEALERLASGPAHVDGTATVAGLGSSLVQLLGLHVPGLRVFPQLVSEATDAGVAGRTAASRAVPPRLHVLLARNSTTAVVIRRGPTRHAAVIGWDRSSDRFEVGQWMYGRIYERRCDLSPDGRHLIYFAMNGRWRSKSKGSWTAISRTPYLKALTFWAKGDCWNGGGLFLSDREYWLNGGCTHELEHDQTRLARSDEFPWHESYGGECPGVYYIRLQRDGWAMLRTAPDDGGRTTLFEKRVHRHWRLRKHAHATLWHGQGRSVYYDTHELRNARTGEVLELPNWEWAEVERETLLWAAEGKLHRGTLDENGRLTETMLHDFTPMKFERLQAPY